MYAGLGPAAGPQHISPKSLRLAPAAGPPIPGISHAPDTAPRPRNEREQGIGPAPEVVPLTPTNLDGGLGGGGGLGAMTRPKSRRLRASRSRWKALIGPKVTFLSVFSGSAAAVFARDAPAPKVATMYVA